MATGQIRQDFQVRLCVCFITFVSGLHSLYCKTADNFQTELIAAKIAADTDRCNDVLNLPLKRPSGDITLTPAGF